MKLNLKFIQLILVASCFFHVSCQIPGGDFIPILSDGAILKPMFTKENSALQYNNERFSIKVAGGEWEGRSYGGSFWIILKNNDANIITVNFDKIQLKNSLEQKLEHSSATQLKHRDEPSIPEKKIVSIAKGETRAYNISFGDTNRTEQIEKREKYLGQTISLTIPVKIELEDKSYEFQFTYGDYLPQGEYNETLID
jgi:hypothetical protein